MEVLHKETEQEQRELVRLYKKLGQEAIAVAGDARFPENEALVRQVRAARYAYNSASERLASLKDAWNEINESGSTIRKVRTRIQDIETQRIKLLSVLGAVTTEIFDSGNLPDELDYCMEAIRQYRRRQKNPAGSGTDFFSRLVCSWKRGSMSRRLEGIYAKVGRLIVESGASRLLSGPRVEAIFLELDNIDRMKTSLEAELCRRSEKISNARTSIETQRAGVNNLKVREFEIECARLDDVACRKEEEYGAFLNESMNQWLNQGCPEKIISCCDEIMKQKKRIYLKQIQSRLLSFDKAIEICEGRIAQFRDRIDYLDNQMGALELQKKDMIGKIASEQQNIDSCKVQQSAIRSLAEETNDV